MVAEKRFLFATSRLSDVGSYFWRNLFDQRVSFALRTAAFDNETGASEQTVPSVSNSFYINNFLESYLRIEEATSVLKQLRLLHSNFGFRLTKQL